MFWQISFLPAQLVLPEALAPETEASHLACPPALPRILILEDTEGGSSCLPLCSPKAHISKEQAHEFTTSHGLQHLPWARHPTDAREMARNEPLWPLPL